MTTDASRLKAAARRAERALDRLKQTREVDDAAARQFIRRQMARYLKDSV